MDSHPIIGTAGILSGGRSSGIEGVGAMSEDRKWMYRRFIDGRLNQEFQNGVDAFVEFASGQQAFKDGEKIRCPCRKCVNIPYQPVSTITLHLGMYGFVPNYYTWRFQGEGSGTGEGNSGDGDCRVEEEEHKAKKHKLNEADGSGTSVALHKGESRWQKYAAYHDGVEFSPVWTYLNILMRADNKWSCNQFADFREKVRVRIETMSRPLPGSTEPQEVDAEQIFADVFEEIPEDTKLRVFEPRGARNAGSVPSLTRDRSWMYRRFDEDGTANTDFLTGVDIFTSFASQGGVNVIKCPCRRCDNKRHEDLCVVKRHLGVFGFVPDYYTWRFHGERSKTDEDGLGDDQEAEDGEEEPVLPKVDAELDEYWAYLMILCFKEDDEWCRNELDRIREEIRVRIKERIRPLPGTTQLQEIDVSKVYLEVYESVTEEMKARACYCPGESEEDYYSSDGGSSGDSSPMSLDCSESAARSISTSEENTEPVELVATASLKNTECVEPKTTTSLDETESVEEKVTRMQAQLQAQTETMAKMQAQLQAQTETMAKMQAQQQTLEQMLVLWRSGAAPPPPPPPPPS